MNKLKLIISVVTIGLLSLTSCNKNDDILTPTVISKNDTTTKNDTTIIVTPKDSCFHFVKFETYSCNLKGYPGYPHTDTLFREDSCGLTDRKAKEYCKSHYSIEKQYQSGPTGQIVIIIRDTMIYSYIKK